MRHRWWLPLTVFLVACDPNPAAPPSSTDDPLSGTGDYEFDGYAPLASRPIRVFYHVPDTASADSPVVLVLHGVNRNADDYRDSWIGAADEHGFVVAAPMFRDVFYPDSRGYALGNVFDNGERPSDDTLNPAAEWTFQWLEPLFDDVVARTPSEVETYQAFGHSAGGQFLHRFVQFVPDARYDFVIAANAGWYTVPDDRIEFPYGLGGTPLEGGARAFFTRDLVVHNGDRDTNPNSAGLRSTSEANAQGRHRLERGEHFFDRSRQLANDASVDFRWKREVIPDVAHNQEEMAAAAADWLATELDR